MIENRLRELWDNLQGKKPHLPHFLSEIRLDGIRGLDNLRVLIDYPVSVIAGGNATGKSTVLFAAACAYRGTDKRTFLNLRPSRLFPNFRPEDGGRGDEWQEGTIDFDYLTSEGGLSMQWQRSKRSWSLNFFGRTNASQPERQVYLRALSDLNSLSRIDATILRSSRTSRYELEEINLTASQIEFAHQMLPFRYSEVVNFSRGSKNLLFAAQESGANYSEFNMAAGERAILRLSQEITQLNGALVLIDEVETGLHPWVQQLLMLHLQQLALRNDLQIIVTSHSPVVLDSVPARGRIFLDRDEDSGKIVVCPPYRDIIQNALYGRSNETLKLLCEDKIAEGILKGVFDFLLPQERIKWESVQIGRDTGASEFPMHARALAKFGQIQDTVFILDGDQRDREIEGEIKDAAGRGVNISILFLPGKESPESWLWDRLKTIRSDVVDVQLGIDHRSLLTKMNQLDAIYDAASDSPAEIAKSKFRNLSENLNREAPEVCRILARLEAERKESDIQPFVEELQTILLLWRE